MRNTIHARHGRKFDSASLTTFFSSREWYLADPMYSDSRLTDVEKANVDPIQELVSMIAIQRRYDAAQKAMGQQNEAGRNHLRLRNDRRERRIGLTKAAPGAIRPSFPGASRPRFIQDEKACRAFAS